MSLRRPSCNGLPDCNPPNSFVSKILGSFIIVFLSFYLAEYLVGKMSNPDISFINITTIISCLVLSVIFIYIFIAWVRRPQSSPGRQDNSCYEINPDDADCYDPKTTPHVRNRYYNAFLFGLALGLLFIVPGLIKNYESDLLLGSIIKLAAFVLAALGSRWTLKMVATPVSPNRFHVLLNWYKEYDNSNVEN